MGAYHAKYIRSLFKSEEEYQGYVNRKIHISWKESTQTVFSGIYQLENLIDEKCSITEDDKKTILDFFVGYAEERRDEINGLPPKSRSWPEAEKEAAKKELSAQVRDTEQYKKQRNRARSFCAVLSALTLLFAVALFFASRPAPVAKEHPVEMTKAPVQQTAAEENYVASINSDKYHLLSCPCAGNILPENRIEINSQLDLMVMENRGYTPCSVCLSDNLKGR